MTLSLRINMLVCLCVSVLACLIYPQIYTALIFWKIFKNFIAFVLLMVEKYSFELDKLFWPFLTYFKFPVHPAIVFFWEFGNYRDALSISLFASFPGDLESNQRATKLTSTQSRQMGLP